MNQEQKDYRFNDLRISDVVIPIYGFVKYIRRNLQNKTTDTANYANAFWHLAIIHAIEGVTLTHFIAKGIESLLK